VVPTEQHQAILAELSNPDYITDISVSRPISRLRWGIPVPDDHDHIIYVWFDALTSYLSAVGYPWSGSNFHGHACGWPPNVQVIGKDILKSVPYNRNA
jgi:methionyl-tRNA synthetase